MQQPPPSWIKTKTSEEVVFGFGTSGKSLFFVSSMPSIDLAAAWKTWVLPTDRRCCKEFPPITGGFHEGFIGPKTEAWEMVIKPHLET